MKHTDSDTDNDLEFKSTPVQPYGPVDGYYDELIDELGNVRPHWQRVWDKINEGGLNTLQNRQLLLDQIIRENGITYNLHNQSDSAGRLWMMDTLPLVIPQNELAELHKGLEQRLRIINLILKDLYGDQELLKSNTFPAKLVMGSPSYLRPCYRMLPPDLDFIHFYAADMARSPDGSWWVMSDRIDAASGLGYTMENRFITNRTYSNVFRELGIKPIRPFLETFRQSLAELGRRSGENPLVVVFTPGPLNETYFEHSYLAKSMGFPLVEANDLTVRDGKLFLKTIEGLRQVNVLLRRVDSEWCDPLELRHDSLLGVPGMLQAVRNGNLAISNFPGCAIAESPAMLAFLPSLCEYLTGEKLLLPSIATWWCGQKAEYDFVMDKLDELIIKPAFGYSKQFKPIFCPDLSRDEMDNLRSMIRERPEYFCAQEPMLQATAPIFNGFHFEARHVLLRLYMIAQGNGSTSLLPGGLGRVAAEVPAYEFSMQSGGQGKDVWVLSESSGTPAETVQLVSNRSVKRQAQTLSSHLADNLFWLGRYVERAEILTRTLTVVLKSLLEESTLDDVQAATSLMKSILFNEAAAQRLEFEDFETAEFFEILGEFVVDQIWRSENLASLSAVFSHIQRTRDVVKERISGNTNNILQSVDDLRRFFNNRPAEPDFPDIYDNLLDFLEVLSGFAGMVSENITRGPDWYFLELGRRTERAMGLLELLSSCLVDERSFEASTLRQILDFADSTITYRQRYLNELSPYLVLDLVIRDQTNPRSLAFQIDRIKASIATLPHRVPFESPHRIDELTNILASHIHLCSLEDFLLTDQSNRRVHLAGFLDKMMESLTGFSECLSRQYFSVT